MANQEIHLNSGDIHPIDMAETLAERHAWEFDRVADDQIAMAIEGDWRVYSLTLAWSDYDETLRMVCSFEMDPPADRMAALYEVMNGANDQCWTGAFTWWPEQKLMTYRYGLMLNGGASAGPEQIDRLVATSLGAAERFYPAFQLACWGNDTPAQALEIAIQEAYGHA